MNTEDRGGPRRRKAMWPAVGERPADSEALP